MKKKILILQITLLFLFATLTNALYPTYCYQTVENMSGPGEYANSLCEYNYSGSWSILDQGLINCDNDIYDLTDGNYLTGCGENGGANASVLYFTYKFPRARSYEEMEIVVVGGNIFGSDSTSVFDTDGGPDCDISDNLTGYVLFWADAGANRLDYYCKAGAGYTLMGVWGNLELRDVMLRFFPDINETVVYNETIPTQTTTTFTMEITEYKEAISTYTANFKYNDTTYPISNISKNGNNINFSITLTSLTVEIDTQINFFFNYTLNGDTYYSNILTQNITAPKINITFSDITNYTVSSPSLGAKSYLNNNTILLYTSDFATDELVSIYFNGYQGNYTQIYQYKNSLTESISENLTILTEKDFPITLRIVDTSNYRIPDALTTIYQARNITTNWTQYKKIGQQYTNTEGTANYILDSTGEVKITAYKSGYTLQEYFVPVSLIDTDNTIIIQLPKTDTTIAGPFSINLLTMYTENDTIYGYLYSPIYTTITYNTQNSTNLTATETNDYFLITLRESHEYYYTDNITCNLYADGELIYTQNITYKATTQDIYDPTITSTKIYNILLALIVILVATIIGFMLDKETAGTHIYLIGIMIITYFSTAFLWTAIICVIHYILRGIYKVTGE